MYYIRDGGTIKGPFTLDQLRDLKLGGEISAWAECRKGEGAWGNIIHIAPLACAPAPVETTVVSHPPCRPVLDGNLPPWTIPGVSFFFPGVGQMIAGRTRNGMLIYAFFWVVGVMYSLVGRDSFPTLALLAVFLGYLVQLYDAWKTAAEMEETGAPQPPAVPALVALLTFMLPGAGHAYSRRFKLAVPIVLLMEGAYLFVSTLLGHVVAAAAFAERAGGLYTQDDKSLILKLLFFTAVALIAHAFLLFESYAFAVKARENYRPPPPRATENEEDEEGYASYS